MNQRGISVAYRIFHLAHFFYFILFFQIGRKTKEKTCFDNFVREDSSTRSSELLRWWAPQFFFPPLFLPQPNSPLSPTLQYLFKLDSPNSQLTQSIFSSPLLKPPPMFLFYHHMIMSWRGSSLFVLVTFVVLCSAKVTSHAMNLTNSTNIAHQEYTQFLLANGVARTPPMGY